MIVKRTSLKFTISTCCGPPRYLYKFDKIEPFRRRLDSSESYDCEKYAEIVNDSKGSVFAFVHDNIKTASRESKSLSRLANPVHRVSVLPQNADIKEYVTKKDVSMHQEYMPVDSIRSALQTYLNKRSEVQRDIWKEIEREAISYLIVEERQLTHILMKLLQVVLPSYLVVGDSSLLTKVDHKICEFATSKPDIIICSANSAATIGTYVDIENDVDIETEDDLLGLTIEAKRNEFELGQTIANMIKVATELSVIAIRKRNFIQKVTVYGIAANYYDRQGKILRLEMDFEERKCKVVYIVEPFPLNFCINAICTLLSELN